LWTLHLTTGLGQKEGLELLLDRDEWLRGWAIQILAETSEPLLQHGSEQLMADLQFRKDLLRNLVRLAREDKSPVVRLFLASALQRLPVDQRWEILEQLVAHSTDAADHNLPLMYWYAAEPAVARDSAKAIALLKASKIPVVREFIARRLASGSLNRMVSK